MPLQAKKIEELKGGLKGEVLLPGSEAYESARKIWNATIDKRPALIVRCATTADVARAVSFARNEAITLAVCGGGHIAGSALVDNGLVVDLTRISSGPCAAAAGISGWSPASSSGSIPSDPIS